MGDGRRVYWFLLGGMLITGYGFVWRQAYDGRHALDPALPPPGGPTSKIMVSYLFHPGDCPDAVEFIEVLNDLRARGNPVSGLMIARDGPTPSVRDVSRAFNIRFPVRTLTPRDASLILGALQNTHTPLAIVRDSSGAIRMLIPGRAELPTAEQLLTLLRSKAA